MVDSIHPARPARPTSKAGAVSVVVVEMSIRRTTVGDTSVLMVSGDVDLGAVPKFTDSLTRLVGDAPGGTVAVDLDGVGYLDDTALGLLLGSAGRARTAAGDLFVVCTDAKLRSRLADTGFDRAVRVATSVAGS